MRAVAVVNCFQFFNFKDYSQGVRGLMANLMVVNCFQFFNFKDYSQAANPGST